MPDMGIIDPLREPKKKNRWIIEFPETLGLQGIEQALKTAQLPTITINANELHRLNERYYVAGKPEFGELSFSFYAMIGDAFDGSKLLYDWMQKVYNIRSRGDMGFKADYSGNAVLSLKAPDGGIVEQWFYEGLWPKEWNGGDLDYSDDEPVLVSAVCRLDRALRKATDAEVAAVAV